MLSRFLGLHIISNLVLLLERFLLILQLKFK